MSKSLAIISMIIVLLLSACGSAQTNPDPGLIQTAIAQTQSVSTPLASQTSVPVANTPIPTDTLTPIVLDTIDLSAVLIQAGDLPAGASGAQIRSVPPKMYDKMPAGVNRIYQQFEHSGKTAGGVAVILYGSPEDIDNGYLFLLGSMGEAQEIAGIGEKAHILSSDIPGSTAAKLGLNFAEIVFERCHAVVHIRMTFTGDIDAISAYAQALDNRLRMLVCPVGE